MIALRGVSCPIWSLFLLNFKQCQVGLAQCCLGKWHLVELTWLDIRIFIKIYLSLERVSVFTSAWKPSWPSKLWNIWYFRSVETLVLEPIKPRWNRCSDKCDSVWGGFYDNWKKIPCWWKYIIDVGTASKSHLNYGPWSHQETCANLGFSFWSDNKIFDPKAEVKLNNWHMKYST